MGLCRLSSSRGGGARAFLPSLLALLVGRGGAKQVVGAAPDQQARFDVGGKFTCLGDGASVPAAAVNDEFCDCADGSDEPGTGACAGHDERLFYCPNEGGTARNLYASRVGDGICDCCDGSDEAFLATRRPEKACQNTCAEQGAHERVQMEKQVNALRLGVAKRREIESKAVLDIKQWKEDVEPLEGEVSLLDTFHEDAKKVREEAEKAEKVLQDAMAPPTPEVAAGCRWRQTGGCKPDGAREDSNDKPCGDAIPEGMSGYCDCNGNGVWDEKDEAGYACSGTPGTCAAKCASKTTNVAALVEDPEDGEDGGEAAEEEAGDEKKEEVVSEYAKWMDGAAETLGGAEADAAAKDSALAAGAAVPQEAAAAETVPEGGAPAAEAVAEDDAETAAAKKALETAKAAHTAAKDAERDARRKLDDKKKDVSDLQGKIDALDADHLGYASLIGKTLEKKFGEHNYKLKFFDNANQEHTSLGRWKGFDGLRTASFDNGASCWNGPMRKLLVKFVCDIEPDIVDVNEPSRCVYEATVKHPGACDPNELATLGGKRVVGPKDEL